MNTTYFQQMLNNYWLENEQAQGEYCVLTCDRVTIYPQDVQEAYGQCPRVTYVNGATASVEVFKDFETTWFMQEKEPEQGVAIYLPEMGLYAVKPLECA